MSFGYSVSTATGRIAVGEVDEIWTPRTPRPGACGVVLLHGSGNPQAFIDPVAQPSSVKLAAALATSGLPCIAGDMGYQTWGNDTIVSRVDAAWTALKSRFPTMRTDKVCLVAGSMGAAGAVRYAGLNPTKVAAIIGIIPLWNLLAFYAANTGAVANQISAAWGTANGAPLPTGADTAQYAAPIAAAGIPVLCGYSTVDTTVLPAWSTVFADAVGATKLVTDSTYGHSDQAVGGLPLATAGQFLARYGG